MHVISPGRINDDKVDLEFHGSSTYSRVMHQLQGPEEDVVLTQRRDSIHK